MNEDQRAAAAESLSRRPEYGWLFEPGHSSWFNVSEVARGAGVSRDTARGWLEQGRIPGAIYYGEDIGWKIPQSGLVEFFATMLRRQNQAG